MRSSEAPGGYKPHGLQTDRMQPLYSILGAYIPFSVLFLLSPLLGSVYSFLRAVSFDVRLWCLSGFLSAIGASCYAGIMTKKSAANHGAADFRGAIITAGGAYLLTSLLRQNVSLAERFIPGLDAFTAVLAALFTWFAVIFLRKIFSVIQQLESLMAEYSGEQLKKVMREFSPEMSEANRGIKKLMVNYGIMFILPCLILTTTDTYRHSILLTVFVFFIFWAGFILLSFLSLLRRELACASEGFSISLRDRAVLFPVTALGICLALLFAVAGSSNTSIVPPETIPNFLAWLTRLISSLFHPREVTDPPLPVWGTSPLQSEGFEGLLSEIEINEPWQGWKYIKYGIIALAAFLFLLFMIHPLLKRSRSSVKAETIRSILIKWLGEIKKGIAAFFAAIGGWQAFGSFGVKAGKIDKDKLRRIASQLSMGVKHKELVRSVNLFARLILWGSETLKVSWRPSLPPGEYCGLLALELNNAVHSPDIRDGKKTKEAVIRCGELFEKALYSPQPLSVEEEKYFKQAIRNITEKPGFVPR